MEVLKKIFLVFFFGVVLLFVGVSIYIQKNGKTLIEEKLSGALQKEVHVGKARLLFPLGLRFDNVEIKDALKAKVLRIHLGLPLFFDGHFNIARIKLSEPEVFLTYSADKKILFGQIPQASEASAVSGATEVFAQQDKPKVSQGIIVDYLEIKEGKVSIFDQVHNNMIDIGHVNLKAMEVAIPVRNMKTKFDLTAVVLSENAPFAGQKAEARGMINVVGRNMDATVKMVDPSGNAGFSAYLKSVKNDMTVKGKINVTRFVSGIKTKDSKESSLEGFLSTALESSGVEIGVDFTCQTKMDDFNCEKLGMSGNVVQTQKNP